MISMDLCMNIPTITPADITTIMFLAISYNTVSGYQEYFLQLAYLNLDI